MTTRVTSYIVFEGGEGTYKSTTARAVVDILRNDGYKVLLTGEPGSAHIPLTMELRRIMLDKSYDAMLPVYGREFISQAIRQIHIETLIRPAYASGDYDFIIQDRGVLSGVVYANACGAANAVAFTPQSLGQPGIASPSCLYDLTVVMHRAKHSLDVARKAKQEFESGDAMESRGDAFHTYVNSQFQDVVRHDYIRTYSVDRVGVDVDLYDGKCDELVAAVYELIKKSHTSQLPNC